MKWLTTVSLALVLVFAFGCSQGESTPTSPELDSEVGALQNTTAAVKNVVLVCHYDIDETDPLVDWSIVEVSGNGASVGSHCANHADFTTAGTLGCGTCDLSGFVAGEDCSSCAPE